MSDPAATAAHTPTTTGADPAVVGTYLARVLDDPAWASCTVDLISGGKSNLTFTVSSDAGEVVLRRPPLGHVLPTAHDMGRESRIMAALAPTDVPVPVVRHVALGTPGPDGAVDGRATVLGAPFYVMDKVDGLVCREALPPGYADAPEQRRAVADGLIDVLGTLHRVDPPTVGLGDFGRPAGFMARQVRRWSSQWDASKSTDDADLDALAQGLADSIPEAQRTGIVHGDYRLDNTMLDPQVPGKIAAVLDWELSSLGDPLADIGLLLVYWTQEHESDLRSGTTVVPSPTSLSGFPTRTQVVAIYADSSGLDLSNIAWYQAFGFFKLAVVVAGVVARFKGGAMLGDGFDAMEDRIRPLVTLGLEALRSGEVV